MGGKNSRMNGNVKGLLKLNNMTFLEKIKETLDDFSSIYLSINDKFSKNQKQEFEKMGFKLIEDIYKEITGKEMTKFYRPPQGIYSTLNLSMAKEMGYHTFFWSLAYVDWYQDNQPDPQEAIEKLTRRIHPGAIVLLHSTSSTNAQILDELLNKWEDMGYSFHSLNELIEHS